MPALSSLEPARLPPVATRMCGLRQDAHKAIALLEGHRVLHIEDGKLLPVVGKSRSHKPVRGDDHQS